jgi:hypothetical protein
MAKRPVGRYSNQEDSSITDSQNPMEQGDTRFASDRFFPAARHKVGTYPYL